MRKIPSYMIAIGAMVIALVWSVMQEPPRFDEGARPLPTMASTVGTGSVQN
ncbi:MAG: hypothetical protein ABSD47_13570 [Candidatus Methylomirabilota bacterium]|jgi:hypothetical protein